MTPSDPQILHAETSLVVVDKPSGWAVHPPGPDGDAPDLLTWLGTQGLPAGLAPAHRLDLGTSGVVVFAAKDTLKTLGSWFAGREVKKRYQALVFGQTRAKGVIRRNLQDARRGQKLEAITRYRTLTTFSKKCSHLIVTPETGRRHQIRRHLQGIGHALVGDLRYRPRGRPTVPAFPGRLWLHAESVDLPDGRQFATPLPAELARHLETLRNG